MMTDEEKIQILKKWGVWDSLREAQVTPTAYGIQYNLWTDAVWPARPEKFCKLFIEFKPRYVLDSEENRTEFMCNVLESVGAMIEAATPDIPEQIKLLDLK